MLTDIEPLIETGQLQALRTALRETDKSKTASKKLKAEFVAPDNVVHAAVDTGPVTRSSIAVTASPAKNTPLLSQRALAPDAQEEDNNLSCMLSFGSVDSSFFA